jgi:hypothetical protein
MHYLVGKDESFQCLLPNQARPHFHVVSTMGTFLQSPSSQDVRMMGVEDGCNLGE